jgi:replication factor A1
MNRYDAEGSKTNFQAYTNTSSTRTDNSTVKPSELKTIGQAKTEQLGYSEKTDYFTTQGTIAFIKQESFDYPACANPEGCNKKVQDNGDGWQCEKCDRKWEKPIYRYVCLVSDSCLRTRFILQINLMDHAGQMWITAFNEVAEQMMGISANDLHAMKDEGNEVEFNKYFQNVIGKTFTFQMMAKQDTYQVSLLRL